MAGLAGGLTGPMDLVNAATHGGREIDQTSFPFQPFAGPRPMGEGG